MKTIKIKAHTRNGVKIKAHTRVIGGSPSSATSTGRKSLTKPAPGKQMADRKAAKSKEQSKLDKVVHAYPFSSGHQKGFTTKEISGLHKENVSKLKKMESGLSSLAKKADAYKSKVKAKKAKGTYNRANEPRTTPIDTHRFHKQKVASLKKEIKWSSKILKDYGN